MEIRIGKYLIVKKERIDDQYVIFIESTYTKQLLVLDEEETIDLHKAIEGIMKIKQRRSIKKNENI